MVKLLDVFNERRTGKLIDKHQTETINNSKRFLR